MVLTTEGEMVIKSLTNANKLSLQLTRHKLQNLESEGHSELRRSSSLPYFTLSLYTCDNKRQKQL